MPKDKGSGITKDVKPSESRSNPTGLDLHEIMVVLNRVFAGEIEYDEALQEFGLFTAEVRKAYPELYKALQRGSKQTEAPAPQFRPLAEDPAWQQMMDFQRQLEQKIATALAVPKEMLVRERLGMTMASAQAEQAMVAIPQNGKPPSEEQGEGDYNPAFDLTEDGQRIYGYRAWTKAEMRASIPGSEWNVRWDMWRGDTMVPMPNEGGPLTVPIEGGRMRFNVMSIEGDVMHLRFERLLPPKQG